MIDLHCHILDGAPCGPGSFAESLEMCRAAIGDGVRTVVATPRWEAGSAEPPLPFADCFGKLKQLEGETRGALSIKLGFALQFSPDLPRLVERHGSKLALAGKRHLLVALPSVGVPEEAEGVWASLARAGFSVVLAHPECNTTLRRGGERLARWVSEGVTLQIDAASVTGLHGRAVRRFAVECLRQYEGSVVVASNAVRSADRKSTLGEAREDLIGSVGVRQARQFMSETPAKIIRAQVARNNRLGFACRSLAVLFRALSPTKSH